MKVEIKTTNKKQFKIEMTEVDLKSILLAYLVREYGIKSDSEVILQGHLLTDRSGMGQSMELTAYVTEDLSGHPTVSALTQNTPSFEDFIG